MTKLRTGWQQVRDAQLEPNQILRAADIWTPPVDIVALARKMDVEPLWVSDMECGSKLVVDGDKATILVKKSYSIEHARSAVAHELGHLMLHYQYGQPKLDKPSRTLEIEANKFGVSLLIPYWMLDPYTLNPFFKIPKLAKTFCVSESLMNIRLQMMAGIIA